MTEVITAPTITLTSIAASTPSPLATAASGSPRRRRSKRGNTASNNNNTTTPSPISTAHTPLRRNIQRRNRANSGISAASSLVSHDSSSSIIAAEDRSRSWLMAFLHHWLLRCWSHSRKRQHRNHRRNAQYGPPDKKMKQQSPYAGPVSVPCDEHELYVMLKRHSRTRGGGERPANITDATGGTRVRHRSTARSPPPHRRNQSMATTVAGNTTTTKGILKTPLMVSISFDQTSEMDEDDDMSEASSISSSSSTRSHGTRIRIEETTRPFHDIAGVHNDDTDDNDDEHNDDDGTIPMDTSSRSRSSSSSSVEEEETLRARLLDDNSLYSSSRSSDDHEKDHFV